MQIQLTKPATYDLEEIHTYIKKDNPLAADRTVSRVLEAIEYLPSYPSIGRIGRVPHTRELIVSSTPFIVVYKIREQNILILRILHAARKWP